MRRWLALSVVVLLAYMALSVVFAVPWAITGAVRGVDDECREQDRPVRIMVSERRWPHIAAHVRSAQADGWPRVLEKNDREEDRRRQAAFRMSGLPAREGLARDEYPPAVGRSTLSASVRYVPLGENSSQGASMGNRLRAWCNGQRFVLVVS